VESKTPALAPTSGTSWSRTAGRFDLIVVAAAICWSILTLWFATAPILGTRRLFIFGAVGLLVGIAWAGSLVFAVQRSASLVVGLIGLTGGVALLTVLMPVTLLTVSFLELWAAVGAIAVALLLFGLILMLERPRRIVWFIVPAITLSTIGLALSGLPRLARFAMAEPALTTYAVQVLERPSTAGPNVRALVTVGGIRVRSAAVRDGCARLVTAHVGTFGGRPAGLAYCPTGPASSRVTYEPLSGSWYRWWSRVSFD